MTDDGRSQMNTDGGLGYLLERAARSWKTQLSAALEPEGVTAPQFFVLVAVLRADLRRKRPPTQRDTGGRLGMDANTASAVIRSLEGRGLLDRTPHPADGRAHALALTDEGQHVARRCARLAREVNGRAFGGLTGSEAQALATLLSKTIDNAPGLQP
jgi:MarR family transcriptional regulator, organic hydroperoxide resistance regulator